MASAKKEKFVLDLGISTESEEDIGFPVSFV